MKRFWCWLVGCLQEDEPVRIPDARHLELVVMLEVVVPMDVHLVSQAEKSDAVGVSSRRNQANIASLYILGRGFESSGPAAISF